MNRLFRGLLVVLARFMLSPVTTAANAAIYFSSVFIRFRFITGSVNGRREGTAKI